MFWSNRDLLNAPFILENFINKNKENKNVISIKYEDVINKPEASIKALYNRLGLPFSNEVLTIKNNTKLSGKYGDHNINSSKTFSFINKTRNNELELSRELRSFVRGYSFFLGEEFLNLYGEYAMLKGTAKKTKVFRTFLKDVAKINEGIDKSVYNRFNKQL